MPLTREDRLRLIEHLKETLDPEGWVPKVGDVIAFKEDADKESHVVLEVKDECVTKVRWNGQDWPGDWPFCLLQPFDPAVPAESPLAYLDRTGYRVQKFYDGWSVDGPTRMGVITRGHATSREAIEAAMAKEGR